MTFFDEIIFPLSLSAGSSGGPIFRTFTARTAGGYEERYNINNSSLRQYNAALGVRSLSDLYTLLCFFEARQGKLRGFRWHDWLDASSSPTYGTAPQAIDQLLGTGDGTTTQFALRKAYSSGGHTVYRAITKPQVNTVQVAIDGVPTNAYTIHNGILTFTTPPPLHSIISAGFLFDVPVRFDTDSLDISYHAFKAGTLPHIAVIEITP